LSGHFFVTVHWRVTAAYAVLYCSLLQTTTTIHTHLSPLVSIYHHLSAQLEWRTTMASHHTSLSSPVSLTGTQCPVSAH